MHTMNKIIAVKGHQYEMVELTPEEFNSNVCEGCVNEFKEPESCDDFPMCWTRPHKERKYYIFKEAQTPLQYQSIGRAIRAAEATKGPVLINLEEVLLNNIKKQ